MLVFRYPEAWSLCEELNSTQCWQKLATAALRCLDIDFGLCCYYWFILTCVFHTLHFSYSSGGILSLVLKKYASFASDVVVPMERFNCLSS